MDENDHLDTHILLIPHRCKSREQFAVNLDHRQTVWATELLAAHFNMSEAQGGKCPQYACIVKHKMLCTF